MRGPNQEMNDDSGTARPKLVASSRQLDTSINRDEDMVRRARWDYRRRIRVLPADRGKSNPISRAGEPHEVIDGRMAIA
jgi:hypothetical protein